MIRSGLPASGLVGSRLVPSILAGGADDVLLPFSVPWPADGSVLGAGWLALGNWAISGGRAVCTPVVGPDELLTDGGLENWASATNLTSWAETIAGTSTINQETSVVHGGSNACRMDIDASTNSVIIAQNVAVPGAWHRLSLFAASNPANKRIDFDSIFAPYVLAGADYAEHVRTGRAATAAFNIKRGTFSASSSLYLDDVSLKSLSLPSLLAVRQTGTADQDISVPVTLTVGLQGGVWLRCDQDPRVATPLNGIAAYHDGTNLNMVKCVNGVYTSLVAAAAAYGADRVVRGVVRGNTAWAYYNGTLIGSGSVSDVPQNTFGGLFATNESVSFGTPTITRS